MGHFHLGKLYLPEAESTAFAQKAAGATVIVTAKLALHEMRRVAFRKESDGLTPANTAETVLSQVDRDIAAGEIRVVEMDSQAEAEFNAIMARWLPPRAANSHSHVRAEENWRAVWRNPVK